MPIDARLAIWEGRILIAIDCHPGIAGGDDDIRSQLVHAGIDAGAVGLVTRGDANPLLKEGDKGFRQWQMDSSKMAPYLTEVGIDHADRIKSLEAKVRDLKAENAHLRAAQARTDAKVDGRIGLSEVRTLGSEAAEKIAAGRPYASLEEFARRTALPAASIPETPVTLPSLSVVTLSVIAPV